MSSIRPESDDQTALSIESRSPSRDQEAQTLSERLGLRMVDGRIGVDELRVVLIDDRIELWNSASRRKGIRIDFSDIDVRTGSGNLSKQQPISKAICGRQDRREGRRLSIIDATAGFGHDAFLLACMGHHVVAIERDPVIHLLLGDAHRRMLRDPDLSEAAGGRLRIEHGDSIDLLDDMDPVDVVYLDPMFDPEGRSSALPKIRAQILRRIVPPSGSDIGLFESAIRRARKRVVVKRSAGDQPLIPDPDLQISGKIVRYDIYLPPNDN
ncbi:MAG: class I SAM-dependent methyltransferase [Phycisphaerales bacterium]|nr:class I SAM-dependent methyltransferase [Phycisphaerales bacterium]